MEEMGSVGPQGDSGDGDPGDSESGDGESGEPGACGVSPRAVLARLGSARQTADQAERDVLIWAAAWAGLHTLPGDASPDPASPNADDQNAEDQNSDDPGGAHPDVEDAAAHVIRGFEVPVPLAGEGAPLVWEFAVADFAAALGLSQRAGLGLLGDAVELAWRLPSVWARVHAGDVTAWRARRVADQTKHLTAEAAGFVDTHVALVLGRVGTRGIQNLVGEAIGRFMPAEAERITRAALQQRHVTVYPGPAGPDAVDPTTLIEARLGLVDAHDFEMAVAAGAAELKRAGSTDSLDVRRAAAVGEMARTHLAVLHGEQDPPPRLRKRLITYLHLHEPDTRPGEEPTAAEEPQSADEPWVGEPSAAHSCGDTRHEACGETLNGAGDATRDDDHGTVGDDGGAPPLGTSGQAWENADDAPDSAADAPDRGDSRGAGDPQGPGSRPARAASRLARVESQGNRIITADQIRQWLDHPDLRVVVKPVIDLNGAIRADAYEIPDRITEHLALRDGTCVFPYCTRPARSSQADRHGDQHSHGCDVDHILPHGHGGATDTTNLAPLCRYHHRVKTHSPWAYRTTAPGAYHWTSPHGHTYTRDHTGTQHTSAGEDPPQGRDPTD